MGLPACPLTGDVGAILLGRQKRFFEAKPCGGNKSPYCANVCLDPACGQFLRQLTQGEGPRAKALAQPVGIGTRQNRLLVTADLAGRKAPGITPQILPLRHTGGTDLKRFRNRTNGLARVSPRQCAFADIFRIGSRHPCWPPFPSMEFESEIIPAGNPDSDKKQHALATFWRDSGESVTGLSPAGWRAGQPRGCRPRTAWQQIAREGCVGI